MTRFSIAVVAALWGSTVQAAVIPGIPFQLNVLDDPGEGFNDPVWGAILLAPFEKAASIWSDLLLPAYPGETIVVGIETREVFPGALGEAAFEIEGFRRGTGPGAPLAEGVWYPEALADHLLGFDFRGGDQPEMNVWIAERFNDVTPDSRPDLFEGDRLTELFFESLVGLGVHEIGHGLGFISNFALDGTFEGFPLDPELPLLFDTLVTDPQGNPIAAMTLDEREQALAGEIFFAGAMAAAVNGGESPVLSALHAVSHFDPQAHPQAIMRGGFLGMPGNLLSAENQRPTALDVAALADLGWKVRGAAVIPVPPALPLMLAALAALVLSAKWRPAFERRRAIP